MAENIKLINEKYVLGEMSLVGGGRKWEDRTFVGQILRDGHPALIVGVVADGVGSADNGARGAELAIQTVRESLSTSQGNNISDLIERAIESAHLAVYLDNQKYSLDGWTTLVVAVVFEDRVFVGNVGDSRAYWISASGQLVQLTRDHNFLNIFGGDANAENANVVVNAIGKKDSVEVDLGFYPEGGNDVGKAYKLGLVGLPIQNGDSLVLCSDGLIKDNLAGKRFVTDMEIIASIKKEYLANAAAARMVNQAEQRHVDDNVSAVTIQVLPPDLIAKRKAEVNRVKKAGRQRRIILGVSMIGLLMLIGILGVWLNDVRNKGNQIATKEPIVIINTAIPMPTATSTLVPGEALVRISSGQTASIKAGATLENGQVVESGDSVVQIGIDESNISDPNTGQTISRESILILFENTSAILNYGEKLVTDLIRGTIYIQPGTDNYESAVKFGDLDRILVFVKTDYKGPVETGSRVIVERSEDTIRVLCVTGICSFRAGVETKIIEVWYVLTYQISQNSFAEQKLMTLVDIDIQAWNQRCNLCLSEITFTPAP